MGSQVIFSPLLFIGTHTAVYGHQFPVLHQPYFKYQHAATFPLVSCYVYLPTRILAYQILWFLPVPSYVPWSILSSNCYVAFSGDTLVLCYVSFFATPRNYEESSFATPRSNQSEFSAATLKFPPCVFSVF